MTQDAPTAYSLREIVGRFGGEIAGDPETRVRGVATLEGATPDRIAFLANARYRRQLETTRAGAVIVAEAARNTTGPPRIICSNPYAYFARVSALFHPAAPPRPGAHASAVIDATADVAQGVEVGPCVVIGRSSRVGAGCVIGPGCVIGDGVAIGKESRLLANVTIYRDCVIGERAIIHSGVVIGSDGFGIAPEGDRWLKVPQVGRVVIGDDVEVGANTTIDRGALDDTVIEDGVKLDNLIQVAHNVRIGAHTAIAACVGIAGSTRIGRSCRIGGGSGIAGHLSIADHVEISAFTLITKSIDQAGTYTGAYAFEPHGQWRRNAAQLRHLADLAERVRRLEKGRSTPKRSKP